MKIPARFFKNILTALFFTITASALHGTHIVGGEMTYTCLGNNQYQITLTIFRDCYYGSPAAWFDNPASIGIFNANNQLISQVLVPLDPMLNDTLDPTLSDPCFVVPPDVCVHTTTYTTVVTLPFIPGGYQLVYQRCCRNKTIVNLINPLDVGATYSINISEAALLECNNSPKFNNWPPLFLCVNEPFQIDQSAVDADGDSLVYRLCNPLDGASPGDPMPQPPYAPPYDTVPWIGNYGVWDMLNGGMGGQPMTIDPHTGLLTGLPVLLGQFVIGICVEEYRNGQLISVSRRDYQVNIGDCGAPVASFFAPEVVCDGLTVNFQNLSFNADDFIWYFDWPNTSPSSSLQNPTWTYPDTGTYTVALIAEPGKVCTDTAYAHVHLVLNSLFVDFQIDQETCVDSALLKITNSSVDTISDIVNWNWVFKLGGTTQTSQEQHPIFTIDQSGNATIELTVTSANGCEKELERNFPVSVLHPPTLMDSLSVCLQPGGVHLNPNGPWDGTFQWTPPHGLDDPTSPNPLANPDSTTTYTVVVSDAMGACTAVLTTTVFSRLSVKVAPSIDTITKGESVKLVATYDPTWTYHWEPPTGLDNPEIHDPVAAPQETTTYSLWVTDLNGCSAEVPVLIVVITACEEPFVFVPTAFSPNADGLNDSFRVMGSHITEIRLIVYDRWGEKVFESTDPSQGWDGTFRGKQLPPDVYGYYVELTCIGGEKLSKKGNVTLVR